jgi:phospholipid/cholesterol/gamma-HCH transport system substrate-binding protein
MMKRASLARALALDPELLFLDEPTAGLDPDSAAGVDELVLKLRDLFGLTVVMITHDLDLLWQVADRVAVLGDGRVQARGLDARAFTDWTTHGMRPFFDGPRARSAGTKQSEPASPCGTNPNFRGAIMETKLSFAAVGAFVHGPWGPMLIAGVLWLSTGGAWQTDYDLYWAVEDESVAGLNLNAPVKYNGVDVGKVRHWPGPRQPPAGEPAVGAGAGFAGQTGHHCHSENPGPDGHHLCRTEWGLYRLHLPLLATAGNQYPVIQTRPSLSARLENVLTSVLGKLDSTSNNINAILSPDNQTAFKAILSNTSVATAKLGPLIDRLGRSADAVGRMGGDLSKAGHSASLAADGIGVGIQRLGTQTLPEVERLLAELETLSSSLRRLTEQTTRDPSGLIFGRTPVPDGPGEKDGKP